MILLEVHLNEKRLCRAGVGDRGVVSAVVTWVNREARDRSGATIPGEREEFAELSVGGLAKGKGDGSLHLAWARPTLKIGDEIRIRVVEGGRRTAPRSEVRVDPKLAEKAERKHLKELKRKYEPDKASSKAGRKGRAPKRPRK